jgi:hypothetical protein
MRRTHLLILVMLLGCVLVAAGQDQSPAPQDTASPPPEKAPSQMEPEQEPKSESPGPKPDLTPDTNGALSLEQMRALIRVVTENYRANYTREREYTYIEREVDHKLDGAGNVKSTQVRSYEIMDLYGEQFERLIEKDDKPLAEKEAAKEEEKIQKVMEKRRNESDEDRSKRQAEHEKEREKNREFVSEVADAYNFRLVGSEVLNGHDTWVIAGEPRPEFAARMKEARMLEKFRGQLWIDKNELQLIKMDVEAIDTVSFGWVLARIQKGTRLVYEQTRVNDEVWLPSRLNFKFNARVALLKGYHEEVEQSYRGYKKFRTTSRIVGYGEVKPQN